MNAGGISALETLERRVLFAGGDLDESFGNGGIVRDNVGGSAFSPDNAFDVAVDAAGRVIVVGSIGDGPAYGSVVRRYLPDGQVDTSFGGGDGRVQVHGDDGSAGQAVGVQSDGKIVVVGQYRDLSNSDPTPVYPFGVYRFNVVDGSIDTTFGGGDGIATATFSHRSHAGALAIQGDGKIVVVGITMEMDYDGGTKPSHWTDDGTGVSTIQLALARFNADGTLDNSFSGDGTLMHRIGSTITLGTDVAVQADGKVVVSGHSWILGESMTERTALTRFTADGALDQSFGDGGTVVGTYGKNNYRRYLAVAIDAENRIVTGGDDEDRSVARYNPDGSLDTSFGDGGIARGLGAIAEINIDAAGDILAGGGNAITRLTDSGAIDTAFGTDGAAKVDFANNPQISGMAVQGDNKIIASYLTSYDPTADFLVARFQGGPGDNGPSPQPPLEVPHLANNPWPDIIDLENEPPVVVTTATGKLVTVPRPKADGSVNIAGTDDPEQITVQPVASLIGADTADLHQRVYFSTSAGVIGLKLAHFLDPTSFQPLLAGHETLLAEAKATLAKVVAQGGSEQQLAKAQANVATAEAGVARVNALRETVAATTQYIRYRLDSAYEIYVAMSGQITDTTRIRIDARGGNDVVAISSGVPLKATIAGGWGADKLTSGRRRSLLMGGGGADRLISRSYIPSVLDGGNGADKYYTRFSECEVMARRGDGDVLVVGNDVISVNHYGTFGFASGDSPTPGKCYYLVAGEDGKAADVLA